MGTREHLTLDIGHSTRDIDGRGWLPPDVKCPVSNVQRQMLQAFGSIRFRIFPVGVRGKSGTTSM